MSRSGKLSSRNSDTYADGCFARALATSEATKTASLIVAELLEFTAEGVTCFQDRIAPTLVEAAQALDHRGHSDFLHREFTLCIALLPSLFYRACGPVALTESKKNNNPSTPSKLCALFEEEILKIVTDQYGYFRIIPGSYPEESVARGSAQEFVASVLSDAIDTAHVLVDSTLNVCVNFYLQELEERGGDRTAEAAEDEAVRIQLSTLGVKDSNSRPPGRPSSKMAKVLPPPFRARGARRP